MSPDVPDRKIIDEKRQVDTHDGDEILARSPIPQVDLMMCRYVPSQPLAETTNGPRAGVIYSINI